MNISQPKLRSEKFEIIIISSSSSKIKGHGGTEYAMHE
jgi:hypothetical protein